LAEMLAVARFLHGVRIECVRDHLFQNVMKPLVSLPVCRDCGVNRILSRCDRRMDSFNHIVADLPTAKALDGVM
jgi:hypothetical protein